MKELIVWTVITGFLLIVFLTVLVFGLVKSQRKFIVTSGIVLLITIISGCYTRFLFIEKSYNKMTNFVKPRTGEEIYTALFGRTNNNCVRIINHQDQVVPKIDYAIWLEFETCPVKLNRILKLHIFQTEKLASKGMAANQPSENNSWFKPELLGDSVLIFKYKKDEYGNGQTIYSSLNSTKVYCIDILD